MQVVFIIYWEGRLFQRAFYWEKKDAHTPADKMIHEDFGLFS